MFLDKGFVTFVVDRKDPSYVWLRARMREHLEDNFPGIEVTEHPGADYYFRAKVTKVWLAEQMTRKIMEADIQSHFKDVMARRAARPKWGSISEVMYAVWNGAAKWQPYAPYSKTPRPEPKPYTPPATGQQGTLFPQWSGYQGKASDYDWSRNPWSATRQGTPIGSSAPDPRVNREGAVSEQRAREISDLLNDLTEEDFEAVWPTLTPEEQDAYLNFEEEELRSLEEAAEAAEAPQERPASTARHAGTPVPLDEDHGAQAALDDWFRTRRDNAYAAPGGGGRRRGRKGKRRKK